MESTTELILQGHFSKLRDTINENAGAGGSAEKMVSLLEHTLDYFRNMGATGKLDRKGEEIYKELLQFVETHSMDEGGIAVPGEKLPMQRAKGKSIGKDKRKTGT